MSCKFRQTSEGDLKQIIEWDLLKKLEVLGMTKNQKLVLVEAGKLNRV